MIRRPPRSTLFPTRRSSDLPCARDVSFYLAAADRARRAPRILETGSGGSTSGNFMRSRNAFWRLRRKPGGVAYPFAPFAGAIWLLSGALRGPAVAEGGAQEQRPTLA